MHAALLLIVCTRRHPSSCRGWCASDAATNQPVNLDRDHPGWESQTAAQAGQRRRQVNRPVRRASGRVRVGVACWLWSQSVPTWWFRSSQTGIISSPQTRSGRSHHSVAISLPVQADRLFSLNGRWGCRQALLSGAQYGSDAKGTVAQVIDNNGALDPRRKLRSGNSWVQILLVVPNNQALSQSCANPLRLFAQDSILQQRVGLATAP